MTRSTRRAQKLRIAERAVVLQVLRDDHPERWTLEELEQEIEDLPVGEAVGARGCGLGVARRGGVQGVPGREAYRRAGADLDMTATVIEPLDELRRFEPVSDAVVLAAIDRAERHRRGAVEGVMGSTLAEQGSSAAPGPRAGCGPNSTRSSTPGRLSV